MILKAKNYLKKFKFCRLINYKFNKNYKNFKNLNLNKKSIIVDIGANTGLISQLLLDKYNCHIECYEPNKYAFEVLLNRFRGEKNVKCYNLGVTEKNDEEKMFLHKDAKENQTKYSTGSSFLIEKDNINPDDFRIVKTISVKKLINKFQNIDLIKIDIEGYEYKILPQIINNKKKIKKVICELHGKPNSNKNLFLQKDYEKLIIKLRKEKLYNSWFFEHF